MLIGGREEMKMPGNSYQGNGGAVQPPINVENGAYNVYIGERYVPLVDGEWDASQVYKPLTIVTYQGNSFTSRQYVPAGITPVDGPYWALTGNFSGQLASVESSITELQNTTIDLSNSITTVETDLTNFKTQTNNSILNLNSDITNISDYIKDSNFLLLADSWGDTGDSAVTGWPAQFKSYLNLSDDTLIAQKSGCGFINPNQPTYLDMVQTFSQDQLSKINYVIVETAGNDSQVSSYLTQLPIAINQFVNYCKNNIPNLKEIIVIPMLFNVNSNITTAIQYFNVFVNITNITVPFNCISWVHNAKWYKNGGHLTNDGTKRFVTCLANELRNSSMPLDTYSSYHISVQGFSGNILTFCYNNMLYIYFSGTVTGDSPVTLYTLEPGMDVWLFNSPNRIFVGYINNTACYLQVIDGALKFVYKKDQLTTITFECGCCVPLTL